MDYFILVGGAAYISTFATIVMSVTGLLFFAKGQPFVTIQDAASVFQTMFVMREKPVRLRISSIDNLPLVCLINLSALSMAGISL